MTVSMRRYFVCVRVKSTVQDGLILRVRMREWPRGAVAAPASLQVTLNIMLRLRRRQPPLLRCKLLVGSAYKTAHSGRETTSLLRRTADVYSDNKRRPSCCCCCCCWGGLDAATRWRCADVPSPKRLSEIFAGTRRQTLQVGVSIDLRFLFI